MNLKNLSSYTIAKNCTDISDCKEGIKELNRYINSFEDKKKVPSTAYIRFYKLNEKLKKLESKKNR